MRTMGIGREARHQREAELIDEWENLGSEWDITQHANGGERKI